MSDQLEIAKVQFDKFVNITKESVIGFYENYGLTLTEDELVDKPKRVSVSAKTNFDSEWFKGQIQFMFQTQNFIELITKCFMKQGEVQINNANAEGAQEILNIVCGTIHRKINNYGEYNVDYSIPSYDWGEFLTPNEEPNSVILSFKDSKNSKVYVQLDIEFK